MEDKTSINYQLIIMQTALYISLFKRANKLKKRFINNQVLKNPTTNRSQDLIKAYRVLIHAEIESYIENMVSNKISHAADKWNSKKIASNILLSLLSYSDLKNIPYPNSKKNVNSTNDVKYRINYAISKLKKKIEQNNGIKEENIIPLIIPLGVDYDKIDQTFLNNMSSFGATRGETAHNSFSVIKIVNPSDEITNVDQILNDLKKFDELLTII